MKLSEWEQIYSAEVDWVLRMNSYEDERFDDMTCFSLLKRFYQFEKELFKIFYIEKTKNITIRYREWFSLCHKYIRKARRENNYRLADFMFHLWNRGEYYFPKHKDPWIIQELARPITKEELEFANKYLIPEPYNEAQRKAWEEVKPQWYSENSKVAIYRNIKLFIDDFWGEAHLYYKKEHRIFSTDWDWWFPVDQFLDLEKGWKNNETKEN